MKCFKFFKELAMEKLMISITLIMICFLCSCKQTPNDVKTKEMSDDISVNYVSAEHILDDFNDAFETKYTKFKLPKKSDVIIDQPEEVNKLELKYVNSNGDVSYPAMTFSYAVRPVFYLNSTVNRISGSGTSGDPFIVG